MQLSASSGQSVGWTLSSVALVEIIDVVGLWLEMDGQHN